MDRSRFVVEWTRVGLPPLVPELRLHLADRVVPIWEAIEARGGVANPPPPYWAFAWPGGQALARFVLDHPPLVAGKTLLDFGSGCGIVGIAAARAGARRVVCAEIDPLALAAIELNAALNGVSLETASADVVGDALDGFDAALLGDMCYEMPLAARITEWLDRLTDRGLLVLLGDPGRNYLPRERLVERARYRVPTTRELEDRDERDTGVFAFEPAVTRRDAPERS